MQCLSVHVSVFSRDKELCTNGGRIIKELTRQCFLLKWQDIKHEEYLIFVSANDLNSEAYISNVYSLSSFNCTQPLNLTMSS